MIIKVSSNWRYVIAIWSLVAAVAVYLFARIYPPELLAPLQALNTDLAAFAVVFGSAPSFFYTLALGLIMGVCASSRLSARVHCLAWIEMAMLLEISQARLFAEPITAWLSELLAESIWAIAAPYWTRGVFDPLDLLATVTGGIIALALLVHLPMKKKDVRD